MAYSVFFIYLFYFSRYERRNAPKTTVPAGKLFGPQTRGRSPQTSTAPEAADRAFSGQTKTKQVSAEVCECQG